MLVTDSYTIDKYYKALLDRNEGFIGIFYVGVKTTSVFCIATCRARKPKLENVLFYTTFKEALDNGYRPCKICKPTENANQAPLDIENAIQLVKKHSKEKISDTRLREIGISPERVRRWFKKHYGITFHTYQRMYRINNAIIELREGKKATTAAFDMGYESLSGFGYTFKKIAGASPKNSKSTDFIHVNRLTTPLGPMFICATSKGICLLEFVDRKMLETEFKDLQCLLKTTIITGENAHIIQAREEVKEYFEGTRRVFNVRLHTPGTTFQNKVWSELRAIPFGTTSTYKKLAHNLEQPQAVRAIGRANGMNRISIIVPCHRVVGKDGSFTGYGGGLERKQWLLDHEKACKVY